MNKRTIFWACLIIFVLFFLFEVRGILLPFVLGMLLAYLLDPLADALERRGVSRTLATAQITIGFLIVVVGTIVLISPLIYHQLEELANDLPRMIGWAKSEIMPAFKKVARYVDNTQIADTKQTLESTSANISEWAATMIQGIFASSLAILNLFSLLLITPVVTFYLLRDWDVLVAKARTLLPREHEATINEQLRLVDATLSGFLRGQLNVCMILGVYYAIALGIAGLHYGILAGILFGFLVIIPYAGTIMSGFIALGLALAQFSDWEDIAIIAGIFVFGQMVEGNFLAPRLVGKQVGVHPVWLIFGLMAGGALFGFIGVLIAVPVTAVIGVFIRFALQRYMESTLYDASTLPPEA